MGLLTRDAILAANDRRKEEVEVPEWGGSVLVATMDGTTRDAWEQSLAPAPGSRKVDISNIRARLVALCCVDEHGQRVFTDADAVELGRKSSTALTRVAEVAQRLNGLTNEALEEAKGN